jgi:hypothetical protein
VTSVQPRGLLASDEELASICVLSGICHAQLFVQSGVYSLFLQF